MFNRIGLSIRIYAILIALVCISITGGNRSRAAKLLGISKPTLHSKIEKYNIKLKTSVEEDLS